MVLGSRFGLYDLGILRFPVGFRVLFSASQFLSRYLLMQLLSTVLVVAICQSIAESINCVRPGGQGPPQALNPKP